MLEVRDLMAGYGLSLVIQGISVSVGTGEIVCLLGRNGVGKTTTLRATMGVIRARSGTVTFKGEDIAGREPFQIARLGIGYVPDDRRIFADLTVAENLEITRRVVRRDGRWTLERVYQLFPDLARLRGNRGGGLSGCQQKMLAIGRALMGNPTLLILDEPSEGLGPLLVKALVEVIHEIRQEGVTLLVADQNLKFARRVGDRGYIIEKGSIRYSGSLNELWANEEVVRKFLAV